VDPDNLLQSFIHSGKTAIRLVTGYIQEFAFLFADRTNFGRVGYNYRIAAITAFPGIFRNGWLLFRHSPFLLS
jgi:hypothetical protein